MRVKMRIEYACTKMKGILKLSYKKKEMLNKIFSANETSDAFNLEWTVLELPVNEIYQKLKYSQ